ncbi:MAG: hypothetical protein QOI76_2275 [Frankiales bacterium]|jgi:hypothetical protein|nr:hypothetical protein [Frankiales bacterium]
MTDSDLRSLLEEAVPEPTHWVSMPAVLQAARRRTNRRRTTLAGGVVVLGSLATVTIPGLVSTSPRPASTAVTSPPTHPAATLPVTASPAATGRLPAQTLSAPQNEEGPVVDWDARLAGGVATSVAQLASVGKLNFPVLIPTFGIPPKRAEVTTARTDPVAKRVVLHYDFGVTKAFPVDGRVVVNESPTVMTVADLTTLGVPNSGLVNKLITVAGKPAVLLSANGQGRVLFVRDGTLVDIAGPALSPAMAMKLAGEFR